MQLGKVCEACGKTRRSSTLLYDPNTLLPYCNNPYICNDNHPNSPKNLIQRGSELELIPFKDAQQKYKEILLKEVESNQVIEQMRKIMQHPLTLRIQDPSMAQFLIELKREMNFQTMAETVRYCIETVQEDKGHYMKAVNQLAKEQQKARELSKVLNDMAGSKKKSLIDMPSKPSMHEEDDDDDLVF